MDFAIILTDAMVLADSSSTSEGEGALILLLFSAGPAFYFFMYRRYRNKDKRHTHELETPTKKLNLESDDVFQRSLRGLRHKEMKDANNKAVHGSTVTGRRRNYFSDFFK